MLVWLQHRALGKPGRRGAEMTEIATQVVTAVATSASTLAAVALTLFVTTRGERRRERDAGLYRDHQERREAAVRNHQERREAAVTFLVMYDAYYFACRDYLAERIDALPIEIFPTLQTAGVRVELFFPHDVREAARNGMDGANGLWEAIKRKRSGEASVEGASVDEMLTAVGAARTVFLQLSRAGVGES
jgi:hypothetical protein